jgi:hypothetical protein
MPNWRRSCRGAGSWVKPGRESLRPTASIRGNGPPRGQQVSGGGWGSFSCVR